MAILTKEYKTPFGELIVGVWNDKLVLADWKYRRQREQIDQRISKFLDSDFVPGDHPIIDQSITQLSEYFSGDRRSFDLPIHLCGSSFQQKVWNELLNIEYGKTYSYLQLSKKLGDPGAIRAAASANGANAISIVVPCHRVIGSDGSLTGYAGGIDVKRKLLELEGALSQQRLF